MTEPLFPFGYATPPGGGPQGMGTMLTRAQCEAKSTVYKLNSEFWRRTIALMEYAYTCGVPLGVGTGWRVQPNPPPPGFAPPGNSNHEGFPADGSSGGAVAIDTVPDVSWDWMERNVAAYGLRTFRNVNDEPWHIQPSDIPASRSYRTQPWDLAPWPLPGPAPGPTPTPDEEDEDVFWRVAKRENGAFFIGDGKTAYWVADSGGDMDTNESLLRMAPGAVNTVRQTWAQATDDNAGPRMVTQWKQVKTTMQDKNLKRYVGETSRF